MKIVTTRQLEYLNQYQTKQTLREKKKKNKKQYFRQKKTFHNDKKANTSERVNNQKCICTEKKQPPNTKTKMRELKGGHHYSTIVFEDFNIPLSIIHVKTRQKISKDGENFE